MDCGEEQAFRGIDIADADDLPGVHEELLDRGTPPARERMQARAVERARERFDAEVAEQRMRRGRLRGPEYRAEAARIAQAQQLAADSHVEVIMLARRCTRSDHAQAARHAKVHDEV